MRALLKNYRQSPRKVRLVADAIRGKKVSDALVVLSALPRRATLPLKKLLESAMANAKHGDKSTDARALFVREIQVNKGVTLKRSLSRAMGRATPINKRSSHITLILGEKENNKKTKK
ncbi:MAG: 50S ribosomal protein L22 [Candidatus Lloydbacteria bacterium]|nr:50S ribosomal protein L22 [Candidatus Lloydbacteria bacterium]